MKKVILKSALMIALVCLSLGAFAQFSTGIVFDKSKLPACPVGKPYSVNIVLTYYYLDNNNEIKTYATVYKDYGTIPGEANIEFPGDISAYLSIKYTKIALSFYGGYCGTGQNFIGVPGNNIFCPLHFVGNWWYTASIKDTIK